MGRAPIVVASLACSAYWQSGYWMDTIRLFDMTLVNTTSNNGFIVTGIAGAMDQAGNRRAAEAYFQRAFKLNPNEPRVSMNYGNFFAHHRQGTDSENRLRAEQDFKDAVGLLTRLVADFPSVPVYRQERAKPAACAWTNVAITS